MGKTVNSEISGDEKIAALAAANWPHSEKYVGIKYEDTTGADQLAIDEAFDVLQSQSASEAVEVLAENVEPDNGSGAGAAAGGVENGTDNPPTGSPDNDDATGTGRQQDDDPKGDAEISNFNEDDKLNGND